MSKKEKLMQLLRFALTKRFTQVIGNKVVSSDGQAFDIATGYIIDHEPISINVPELFSGSVMDLDTALCSLYTGRSKLETLLAFATAVNHNIRSLNVIVTDVSRYIDVNSMAKDTYTYLYKLLHQLTYHLAITKNFNRRGLEALGGIDWKTKPVVKSSVRMDILDISPYYGLTVELSNCRLSVSVMAHEEVVEILNMQFNGNQGKGAISVNIWNLYYDTSHSIGELIKSEMEKLGLLDLYIQQPTLRRKLNSM